MSHTLGSGYVLVYAALTVLILIPVRYLSSFEIKVGNKESLLWSVLK